MTYEAAVLVDTPVAFWRFTETSGTSLADSSGNSRTATVAGSVTLDTSLLAPLGSALQLNGDAANYASAAHHADLAVQTGAAYTVEAWIDGRGTILSKHGSDASGQWAFRATSDHRLHFDIAGVGVGQTATDVLTGVHHVVACARHSPFPDGARVKFWVDGQPVAVASSTIDWVTFDADSAPVRIGSANYAGNVPFNGTIDEVAVYNYELSDAEVLAHYEAGTAGETPTYDPATLDVSVVDDVATLTSATPDLAGATHIDYFRRVQPVDVEERGLPFDPEVDTPIARVALPTLTYDDEGLENGTYEWQAFAVVVDA